MKSFSQISRQVGRSMFYNLISNHFLTARTTACRWSLGRTLAVLFLAAGICLIAAAQVSAAAPGCPECQYRRSITIDSDNMGASCGGNISNFPVLISIVGEDFLKWADWGGKVGNSNGYDISFTDAGGTPLNHEVELYNPATGTLAAWVNVPALSAGADTVIYLVYGDVTVSSPTARPSDVWDSHYRAVWHMNQAPTGAAGDILDSTANANHGQSVNMAAGDRTGGRIGKALNFDGITDYIQAGDLTITGNITVEFWINPNNISGAWDFYIGKTDIDDWDDGWGFYSNSDNLMHFYVKHYHTNDITASLITNRFQHFVGVYDGNQIILYKNGSPTSQNYKQGIPDSGTALTIGSSGSNSYNLNGRMDEVRISSTARDACWIETEYNNQHDPSAFYLMGEEEDIGEAAVTTYTVTATAGANGSILPVGEFEIEEGTSVIFELFADENYEPFQVKINNELEEDNSSDRYEFGPVYADGRIHFTFQESESGEPVDIDDLPPGCSQNVAVDYSGGFDPEDLDIVNTEVNAEQHILLNTGNIAIDPNNIVIPFEQQVSVCFMYEGAGDRTCDFGWMLASEGINGTKHEIYYNIMDEDAGAMAGNGVLDVAAGDTTDRFGDRNGDGVVNALDNCEVIGNFEAGTELVFWLNTDSSSKEYRDFDYADDDDPIYWYTKTAWNKDRYTSNYEDLNVEEYFDSVWFCDYGWGDPFKKTYYLGRPRLNEGKCNEQASGWMDQGAIDRASSLFGLNFGPDDESSLLIDWGERFSPVMVGAPADNLNAWVLGYENAIGGGDTDHNDIVFVIERETGGTVGLKPAAAITAGNSEANINGVTLGVWDYMPHGQCDGKTDIAYWLSIDAGENWVAVDGWDEVYRFMLKDGEKTLKNSVKNWAPGTPEYTYRTRRVDFNGLGLSGRQLIWRADLKSRQQGCEPKIIDLELDFTASTSGLIGRSTPTILANVMYTGHMETPAPEWSSDNLRGHLKATRIYDPADPSQTATMELWNAGTVLKDQMLPRDRTIYIPDVTVHIVDTANAERLGVGDGVTTFFSGRLAHHPVLATTVTLTDTREVFTDWRTDVLDGSLGGSGWINRATGEYRMEFATAPAADQPITATYSYFTYNPGGALRSFVEDNVPAAELGLDDAAAIPSGYVYDFNQDNEFNTADVNWLINWTRGYQDGNGKLVKKEWVLGPVDHSVPAVATPPVFAPWYYGTAFPEDTPGSTNDRKGYREFREAHVDRRTVVYVGARDGMLHAFDAGQFNFGDNPCTEETENRGFFKWTDPGDPDACQDPCSLDCEPDYGTGEELWAFIPANLLPRLKHNLMQGDDQSYVDASPALADVYTNGAWRTVLLAAEGNGGDTVFCLDVTDPYAPRFMWEFADPLLFRSRSSPAVAQIGRIYYGGSPFWVAFFVSGKTYDDTLYPVIFAVDIASGRLLGRIELDAEKRGAGGVLSGQPAIVDSDGNGYIDRLYIGSDKGLMYKVNIPDSVDDVKYGLGHCVVNKDYSDRDGNQVPKKWRRQPIYASPTVVASNSVDASGVLAYDIRIFFFFFVSPYYDEDINFADTRYLFYAYTDTSPKGTCDNKQVDLDWFFELPEGHRIYASAFAAAGNIYFGTSTGETEDPCDIDSNSDNDFDPNAGKLYAFDMHNPADGPLLERTVGNVLAAPVVVDRHIYVQSASGDVDSFGSGQYNSAILQGGIPQIEISWWREMY